MQKTTDVFYDTSLNCYYAFTTDGTRFLFDECDAALVQSRGWHVSKRGYVAGKEHRRESPIHKLMLSADTGFDIDHINRDKMDNRRNNLRVVTHHENCMNQSMRATNTSGFMGVSFVKNIGKYESYIHFHGIKHNLGYYISPQEAAYYRDAAARALFGEYCFLNFPDEEVAWWAE